jgi:hypothetical protein
MSIERDLARVADALEKIAASFEGAAAVVSRSGPAVEGAAEGAREKPAEDGGKKDGDAPSLDEVVAALQKYMKANGRDAAVKLLAKFGAKRASDIDEAKRADFVKEAS